MGNSKMCDILNRADHRAYRMKLGTCSPRKYLCKVFLISDSLSAVWGHSAL